MRHEMATQDDSEARKLQTIHATRRLLERGAGSYVIDGVPCVQLLWGKPNVCRSSAAMFIEISARPERIDYARSEGYPGVLPILSVDFEAIMAFVAFRQF